MSEDKKTQLISIDPNKCTLCYACIRVCPIEAIEVKTDKNYARVIDERCIGCGSCLSACAFNAISYRKSIDKVENMLDSHDSVAVILDPAIAGEFEDILDYRKFAQMLRLLGFSYVHEASFSIDVIGEKFKQVLIILKEIYFIILSCSVSYRKIFEQLAILLLLSISYCINLIIRQMHKSENLKLYMLVNAHLKILHLSSKMILLLTQF